MVQGLSFRLTQFHSNRYGKYNADADSAWQLLKASLLDFAEYVTYRGSYMSAHVLLNLSNMVGKGDKMRGLQSILSLFLQQVLQI